MIGYDTHQDLYQESSCALWGHSMVCGPLPNQNWLLHCPIVKLIYSSKSHIKALEGTDKWWHPVGSGMRSEKAYTCPCFDSVTPHRNKGGGFSAQEVKRKEPSDDGSYFLLFSTSHLLSSAVPSPFIFKVLSPGAEKKMRLTVHLRYWERETPTERQRGEWKHSSPVGRGAWLNDSL